VPPEARWFDLLLTQVAPPGNQPAVLGFTDMLMLSTASRAIHRRDIGVGADRSIAQQGVPTSADVLAARTLRRRPDTVLDLS
jgi:hypothetical protein